MFFLNAFFWQRKPSLLTLAVYLFRSTKKIFPSICLLFSLLQISATIKTATGNAGQGWSNASNWNPAGVPQNGDTVIVPLGITISVKGQIYSSTYPTLLIKIFGTLDFDPSGKIDLSSTSAIGILTGAYLTTNGTSSEIITIGGVTKFNGQTDGNLTGPKYASASTGISPGGFVPGVLSIKLLSFNYKIVDNKVKLMWTVIQESDLDEYEIQRSDNSEHWQPISTVHPTGLIGESMSYSFEDATAPNNVIFYRLDLKSIDASSTYSKLLVVNLQNTKSFVTIFPNPAGSEVKLQWKDATEKEMVIKVLDNTGKTVMSKKTTGSNFTSVSVNQLPAGIYNILFFVDNQMKCVTWMVVRK